MSTTFGPISPLAANPMSATPLNGNGGSNPLLEFLLMTQMMQMMELMQMLMGMMMGGQQGGTPSMGALPAFPSMNDALGSYLGMPDRQQTPYMTRSESHAPWPRYPQQNNKGTCSVEDLGSCTAFGDRLANLAYRHATDGTGDGHHCYHNVKDDLRACGVNVEGGSAFMAANQLAANPRFREVRGLGRGDLASLPKGAVVVWGDGPNHPHGHISVAQGNGTEASDVMRRQIEHYPSSFRVFLPQDEPRRNTSRMA